MKKLCHYISEYMGVLVLAAALLALLFPDMLQEVRPTVINYLLGVVMFGMGLTLNLQDFRIVFSRPKDVVTGCLAQFTVMPLLAWGLARLFQLDEALALGVVLVGCCPGGTASNVITYLSKGDLALSVGMTGVSTVLAPLLTPLLTWALAGKSVPVDVASMFLSILWVVILPIVAGLTVKWIWPRFTERATDYLPAFSSIAIALIVAIIIAANADKLLAGGLVIVLVVMLHNVCGLGLGYLTGRLLGLSEAKKRAISIEVGMQNSGLASSLATIHFAAYPLATIPGAIFSVWHNLSGAAVAYIYKRGISLPHGNNVKRQPEGGRKKIGIKPVSLFAFSCIVSLGTLLLYNLPFFSYVANNSHESAGGKAFLLASLVVAMLAVNFAMTYLAMFLLRTVGRILLAILSVINATAVYFIITYSVIIDATTIENVFNTRYSEASGFFSGWLWLFILAVGALPALYCMLQPVVIGKAKKLWACCGGALAVVLVVALTNFNQTLWVSQHDTELGGLLQPWSYLVNTGRIVSFSQDEQAEEIKLPDGRLQDDEKAVVVLVIGESARKANFQLYGYGRDTNPRLSKQEGLKVYQATSCATYTTAGTKAILEPKNSDDLYELLPNYAFRTGVDVSWRTSNWGEPPIHIDEYLTDDELGAQYPDVEEAYDAILFTGLRERIESSRKNKVLIVLHTSTSHGPKYADKYPKEFEVYKPVARNVEEGEKNVGMLINAYDNTIRYTDFLLDSLINTLRDMTEWHSAMIFISDHGESLGENKMFMHGLPMKIAPKVQYEIPFLVWTSEHFRDYKAADELPEVLEQHYIFHSVLNLLSIHSPAYDKQFDIFKARDGGDANRP